MRLSIFVVVLLAACGSEAPAGGDASPVGDPDGPFDLDVTVREVLSTGEPATTYLFAAIRDADTHELIAFAAEDKDVVSSVKLAKRASLIKGHRYEVGIKDTWYSGCLEAGANVWYRSIPAVIAPLQLDVTVQVDVGEDKRGCDVLHEPIALAPGTYSAPVPIDSITGNRVVLVVSPSGRVYTNDLRIYCGDTSTCLSTSVSLGTCKVENAIYPGASMFELGSSLASHTQVTGQATIEATGFHYTGRVYTWVGTSSICCDRMFDVTLTKTAESTAGCL